MNDSVREAINKCLEAHRDQMIQIMQQTAKAITNDFLLQTQIMLSTSEVSQATWNQHQWNNLDTIQLLVNFTPLQFLGNLVVAQAKISKEIQDIRQYQQQLQATLPEFRQSLKSQVKKLYTSIADKMEEQIQINYQQDLEASLNTLNQAMNLANESEEQLTATNESIQQVSVSIAKSLSSLKEFKQKMWSTV